MTGSVILSKMKTQSLRLENLHGDIIELERPDGSQDIEKLRVTRLSGCWKFLKELNEFLKSKDLTGYPAQEKSDHARAMIRQIQKWWDGSIRFSNPQEEICHCRSVPQGTIEKAILSGAKDSYQISRWTQASKNCGTCRPLVESILSSSMR